MTLIQGNQTTLTLAADEKLTVVVPADAAGAVTRLPDSSGGSGGTYRALAASTTTVFGPFPNPTRFLVVCGSGSLTATVAHVDLAALKAAAVVALTDSSGGIVAASLVAVTDTTATDQALKINANFASLNAKLEALKAAMVTAGTLTA